MKIFNTYTNILEEFVPLHKKEVSIYVCGPTVYNYIHIGNARPVVFFDTVRRFLEASGYKVKYASNFTDVDDKIIQKALEEKVNEFQLSSFYIDAFNKDLESLGCYTEYMKPRVSEYMQKIIGYIDDLVKKQYAYVIDGDVYFRVSKMKEYGKLSNQKLDDLISGARVEINLKKESPLDFTLWKKTFEGVSWEAPFSIGRPGWHTECVCMIDDLFGGEIDIHGGGADLIFPHHENEIAQSFAKHKHNVARIWMHNGRLNTGNEKMSKSEGYVMYVKDIPSSKMAFRMYLLSTHYRSPINFNLENLMSMDKEWEKLENTVKSLFRKIDLESDVTSIVANINTEIQETIHRFNIAMDSDFNTPNAITELQGMIKLINVFLRNNNDVLELKHALEAVLYMLGILGLKIDLNPLSSDDRALIQKWEQSRKEKDFALADELRNKLLKKDLL